MSTQPVQWRTKARPAGGPKNNPADDLGVEIHHTAGTAAANADQLVQVMLATHQFHTKTKGWADVFYGYVVARDGSYAEGRGFHRGTTNKHRWITLCLAGDYTKAKPTAAQIATCRMLRDQARQLGAGDAVRGHGDRDNTACPGDGGRQVIAALLDQPAPTPAVKAERPFTVSTTWRVLGPGARGQLVRVVQGIVSDAFGQAAVLGARDGIYGDRTGEAVANVQRYFDVEASGVVGPTTAKLLLTDWDALS